MIITKIALKDLIKSKVVSSLTYGLKNLLQFRYEISDCQELWNWMRPGQGQREIERRVETDFAQKHSWRLEIFIQVNFVFRIF